MTLEDKVIESLDWRKNPSYCAKRIGISLAQYKKIKSSIKKVEKIDGSNLQNDSNIVVQKRQNELPKTPEELVEQLGIDTKHWILRNFWHKQSTKGWLVSAHVVKKDKITDKDLLLDLMANWEPKTPSFRIPNLKKKGGKKIAAVLSLQDLHYGKLSNDDIDMHFKNAVIDLVGRANASYYLEDIYLVVGGDLLNVDTFNKTTTSGTPVENGMDSYQAYGIAFNSFYWAINYIKAFCDNLHVVYIPGNHDRLTSFCLVHALSKAIKHPHIYWNTTYEERKALKYYNCFFGFEHGDVKSKDTPLIYATEYSEMWGKTKHRVLFTGHYHKNKKTEYITEDETVGFAMKILPSLSVTDYYHYHNKFVGNARAALIDLYDPEKGYTGQMRYLAY